jgi:hypothetical protein
MRWLKHPHQPALLTFCVWYRSDACKSPKHDKTSNKIDIYSSCTSFICHVLLSVYNFERRSDFRVYKFPCLWSHPSTLVFRSSDVLKGHKLSLPLALQKMSSYVVATQHCWEQTSGRVPLHNAGTSTMPSGSRPGFDISVLASSALLLHTWPTETFSLYIQRCTCELYRLYIFLTS